MSNKIKMVKELKGLCHELIVALKPFATSDRDMRDTCVDKENKRANRVIKKVERILNE